MLHIISKYSQPLFFETRYCAVAVVKRTVSNSEVTPSINNHALGSITAICVIQCMGAYAQIDDDFEFDFVGGGYPLYSLGLALIMATIFTYQF